MKTKNAWEKYNEAQRQKVMDFAKNYKDFLSICKTERECVDFFVKKAKELGFADLKDIIKKGQKLAPGDKVYATHMKKTLALFKIGSEPIENGMNILGAHIDSPRLDIKQNPLYEDSELALFDTHYYGGVKKYQWVTIPLSLHGVVAKKDGSIVNVVIGEKEDECVFGVSDLLIHLANKQMDKAAKNAVEGEALNILVGSIPEASDDDENKEKKDKVKANILSILKQKYDIEEADFLSAELEAVPQGSAKDYGFDNSMIMAYGQDDRVCAFPSFCAMTDAQDLKRTACCLLVDKEEIGSVGATGMHSKFFENTVAEILTLLDCKDDITLRRSLFNSCMLSSDVSAAFDPNYPDVMDKNNAAYLCHGMALNKFTGSRGKSGSNDANAEYLAKIRNIFDNADASFQLCELGKVDAGGGGTIAYIMANYGMNVIDSGVAVLNMHAPWEITSKADLFESYKGYKAFIENCTNDE